MLASAHFGIQRTDADDWFDTILDVDTELFVDPFLIFKEEDGFWADAHARLIEHFNRAFLGAPGIDVAGRVVRLRR